MMSEERQLLAFAFGIDEHLAEDVEEHVNDDAVTSELILCRVADSRGLYLVDVLVVHSHEAEALARCQLTDAEFFAMQFYRELNVLLCIFHNYIVVFKRAFCQSRRYTVESPLIEAVRTLYDICSSYHFYYYWLLISPPHRTECRSNVHCVIHVTSEIAACGSVYIK